MRTVTKAAVVALGAVGVWSAYRTYSDRQTESVDYEVVDHLGRVELRRYPDTVVVETTASGDGTAFRRLFRYIAGDNVVDEEISMTTPVATESTEAAEDGSTEIPMTTPVATESAESGVRMQFFLPKHYTAESAPKPTDDSVTVRAIPGRTVAVLPFTWYATDRRVEKKTRDLLATLTEHGVSPTGEPFVMQYEGPGTPPFMRRNEVAVEVPTR
ncbi:SOUL family heme-binding protein [Halobium salinum]|uniref:SOUL family heme-binding protein n=1 Tax=Halobium salinum TaxID=1364940 RepID=A0ABD5PAK0_9EURY|nr:heme-binding protein [Halobium salinum]